MLCSAFAFALELRCYYRFLCVAVAAAARSLLAVHYYKQAQDLAAHLGCAALAEVVGHHNLDLLWLIQKPLAEVNNYRLRLAQLEAAGIAVDTALALVGRCLVLQWVLHEAWQHLPAVQIAVQHQFVGWRRLLQPVLVPTLLQHWLVSGSIVLVLLE